MFLSFERVTVILLCEDTALVCIRTEKNDVRSYVPRVESTAERCDHRGYCDFQLKQFKSRFDQPVFLQEM